MPPKSMQVQSIPLDKIEISKLNTRKDLAGGTEDSTIDDLAQSIKEKGLLSQYSSVPSTKEGTSSLPASAGTWRANN